MGETGVIAMSPLIIECCSMPHRIAIRDLGDQFVVHMQVFEDRRHFCHHGHYFNKSNAVASVAISDRAAVVKGYMCFDRRVSD
jgi:hypothetical protein